MTRLLPLLAALALAGCATTGGSGADHPEARSYDAGIDAIAAVDAALVRAEARDTRVLMVLGANWCAAAIWRCGARIIRRRRRAAIDGIATRPRYAVAPGCGCSP